MCAFLVYPPACSYPLPADIPRVLQITAVTPWCCADELLGPSLQLPGSLLGALWSASDPLLRQFRSEEEAIGELQRLADAAPEDDNASPDPRAAQFSAELNRLGAGSLLLRQAFHANHTFSNIKSERR